MGGFAFMGAARVQPAAPRPPDAIRCMNCPVGAHCVGGVAAHAGTRQLQGVLEGRRRLRVGESMWLPAAALLAVRSGFLESLAADGDTVRPCGFHFAGDAVVGGRSGVQLVALEEAEVCFIRAGAVGGGGACGGRLWDMMSRELLRGYSQAMLRKA